MKPIQITLISIVITALIVGGSTYYFINAKATKDKDNLQSQITDLNKKLTNGQTTSTNPINTSKANPDPTADWKTFSSDTFGWSMKYPDSLYIDKTYSENNFSQRGDAANRSYIGGDTSWANYDLNTEDSPDKITVSSPQGMDLMVYKETDSMTIQQYASKYGNSSSASKVKAGNIDGMQYTFTGNSSGATSYDTSIATIFKKGSSFYVINYGNPSGLNTTFLKNYKTMLATLSFTK